jgi:hypothetical protein
MQQRAQAALDELFWEARGMPVTTGRTTSGISGIPRITLREFSVPLSEKQVSTWAVLDVGAAKDLEGSLIFALDGMSSYLEGPYGHVHPDVTLILFKNGALSDKVRRMLVKAAGEATRQAVPDSRIQVRIMDYSDLKRAARERAELRRQARRPQHVGAL